MKNKNKICCLFLLSLLCPTSVFASDIDDKSYQIEENMNLIQGKIGNLSRDINELENELKVYGDDYTYTYNSSSSSFVFTEADSYSITNTSFMENKNNDSTVAEMLQDKITEKEELEKQYTDLENTKKTIDNFKKIQFNPQDLTKPSNLTVEEIKFILRGTKLYDLAQDFYDAEQKYGVNSFFIIGLCAEESGWGTSRRAVFDNNLTGFGVYSNDSEGINSGTKRENIMLTSKTLKNNYLTENGKFYNGTSIDAVSMRYCKSDTWASKITNIGNNLINDLQNNFLESLEF